MFANREGQIVPQVTFRIRAANEWKSATSDDIFKGKTVVVFSLPGAFTPTCSSVHVPRYNGLAPAFYANGVDTIVCISVIASPELLSAAFVPVISTAGYPLYRVSAGSAMTHEGLMKLESGIIALLVLLRT